MPARFNIETGEGSRLVEFDPDVLRGRDIRILVDGHRTVEMPHPKPNRPYQEALLRLDGRDVVAMAYLPPTLGPTFASLELDLFADGRSLSGGPSLEEVRERAARAGIYPSAFRLIDTTLVVTPVAGTPAMFVGLSAAVDTLGFDVLLRVAVVMLGALAGAVTVTRLLWSRIRADEALTVTRRSAYGWAVLLLVYAVALIGGVALAIVVRGPI